MSTQCQHTINTASTVDIVFTFFIATILSYVIFSNDPNHNLEFIQYLEFTFDHSYKLIT